MPSGVYTRTAAHGAAVARGKREAEVARQAIKAALSANGSEMLISASTGLGPEQSTAHRRAAADLADYTSTRMVESVEHGDFAMARAWLDLSESISNSE